MNSEARLVWFQFVSAYFAFILAVLGLVNVFTTGWVPSLVFFIGAFVLLGVSLAIRWSRR